MSWVRMRVANSDWWASRRVVSVSAIAVCERSAAANAVGPSSSRRCREPAGGAPVGSAGSFARGIAGQRGGRGLVVDGDLGQPPEQPAGAVAARACGREVGPLVDERRVGVAGEHVGVVEEREQEALVGLDAADAQLGDGAARARHRALQVAPAGRDLDQQRVEERRDLGADERRALVEPHPRSARRAVRGDPPGVGPEPVRRVLGRHPALQREAALADLVLRAHRAIAERRAARDLQLRAHQVDVGRLLGDRVLDLDPRVHLDERVPAGRRIEQELDRARVDVADVAGELDGIGADAVTQLRREVRRRRDLDHLLMAALQRAVALEEVHDVAGGIGQQLDLDVARAHERLLEVDGAVAERRRRFAARLLQRGGEARRVGHEPHAAATAAVRRLDEEREADLLRRGHRGVRGLDRRGGVEHRHTRLARGSRAPASCRPRARAPPAAARRRSSPAAAQARASSGFSDMKP